MSYEVARVEDGSLQMLDPGSQSEIANLGGLSRRPRALQAERNALGASVDADRWIECDGWDALPACVQLLIESGSARTFFPQREGFDRRYCGELVLVRRDTLPWAWRHHPGDVGVAVAGIDVECAGPDR